MASVSSPHVVRPVDHGTHEGFPYLVMEYLHGGSLRDLLDSRSRLPPKEACWVVIQALRGLRKAGTVHRDLKPDNLLIQPASGGGIRLTPGDTARGSLVKVGDFGLAKSRDPNTLNLTNSQHVMGTPIYMSPEQCRNTREVGIATDIYALGVILYECVAGKPPFDGESAYDIMTMHCNDAVRWPRGLDARLQAVLERCLAKKPEHRYASLRALERDLAALAGLDEPEPERTAWIWWSTAAAVAVIVVAAWLLQGHADDLVARLLGRIF
jgi:eukaryotic-like serine/threonine-protein kinase